MHAISFKVRYQNNQKIDATMPPADAQYILDESVSGCADSKEYGRHAGILIYCHWGTGRGPPPVTSDGGAPSPVTSRHQSPVTRRTAVTTGVRPPRHATGTRGRLVNSLAMAGVTKVTAGRQKYPCSGAVRSAPLSSTPAPAPAPLTCRRH